MSLKVEYHIISRNSTKKCYFVFAYVVHVEIVIFKSSLMKTQIKEKCVTEIIDILLGFPVIAPLFIVS